MTSKIKTSKGEFSPGSRNHLGTGGQASVYEFKGDAVKIYTDVTKMVPQDKVKELMQIQEPRVIRPNGFAFEVPSGKVVGYTMPLLDPKTCEPACKFFTAIFKKDHGLGMKELVDLTKELRIVLQGVHQANCLVVDFNELNILVEDLHIPKLIDTDSFQTPHFPATAIMESIRDFQVKVRKGKDGHGHDVDIPIWTQESDWFSWGIIAFQMLIGIHPFKGSHPNFKLGQWVDRMKKSVSVFDPAVKLPPIAPPFTVLPPRLRGWFEDTFQKGNRSMPPDPDQGAPAVVLPQIVVVKSSGKFSVNEVDTFGEMILDAVSSFGALHVLTTKHLYRDGRVVGDAVAHTTKVTQSRVVPIGSDGTMQATWNGLDKKGEVVIRENGIQIDRLLGSGLFVRNGAVYSVSANDSLAEITFHKGVRTLASMKSMDSLISRSARAYDGVVIQGMLGRTSAIFPYEPGKSLNRIMPELDGYRVVDAQAHWPVLVVVAEKAGKFDRLVFGWESSSKTPRLRIDQDIAYSGINMTVTHRGICVMLHSDNQLSMCKATDPTAMQVLDDPPIDSSMKLFTTPIGTFFINGNSIFRLDIQ